MRKVERQHSNTFRIRRHGIELRARGTVHAGIQFANSSLVQFSGHLSTS